VQMGFEKVVNLLCRHASPRQCEQLLPNGIIGLPNVDLNSVCSGQMPTKEGKQYCYNYVPHKLPPILILRRSRRGIRFYRECAFVGMTMTAALVSDECDRDENEDTNENDTLFIF
jgi:hypothetical protein